MSYEIPIDLDETPDDFHTVEPGNYVVQVKDVRVDEENPLITFVDFSIVNGDNPDEIGNRLFERFNFEYEGARISFKKFVKACGLAPSGKPQTSDLIDCTVSVSVTHRTYKDADGEQRTVANIKKYHIDGGE